MKASPKWVEIDVNGLDEHIWSDSTHGVCLGYNSIMCIVKYQGECIVHNMLNVCVGFPHARGHSDLSIMCHFYVYLTMWKCDCLICWMILYQC